jgi:hypothetical protein
MVARQRFYDTMTTLRTTIQSEYEEVRTSINERLGKIDIPGCTTDGNITSGDKTGNSKCLAIGKLIQFMPGSQDIKISYVVSTSGTDSSSKGDIEALRGATLKIIGDAAKNVEYDIKTSDAAVIPKYIRIEWGGKFDKSWTIPTSGNSKPSDAIAILRSPVGSAVIVFSFASGSSPISSTGVLNLGNEDTASVNRPIAIMIANSQQGFKGGAICVDGGASSVSVRSAVPADDYYEFNANETTYSPQVNKLKELCNI